jgi:hypothetical protein
MEVSTQGSQPGTTTDAMLSENPGFSGCSLKPMNSHTAPYVVLELLSGCTIRLLESLPVNARSDRT